MPGGFDIKFMEKIVTLMIALMVASFFSAAAFVWLWEPQSYDECIIEESSRFQGPAPSGAIYSVQRVCREQFPHKTAPPTPQIEAIACNPPPTTGPAARRWIKIITSTEFRFMPEFMRINERDKYIKGVIARNPDKDPVESKKILLESTTPPRYVACP